MTETPRSAASFESERVVSIAEMDAQASPEGKPPTPPTGQSSAHRVDIDGLRAIAVALVVAFHIRFPGFEGGFIGVDMFFVISGFLITGILAGEYQRHDTVRLGRFWARRIRRLLPASTATLLVTVLASFLLLSPIAQETTARTALFAAAYIPNIFLAIDSADYFASDISGNPVVHFWSLAVEEQFYLAWPVVMLGLSALAARLRQPRLVLGGLALITVISFAHSVQLTNDASTWAYYSPFSRAWEFAVGGLLAIAAPEAGKRLSQAASTLMAGVGFLGIAYAILTIDSSTPFPGWNAVIPVAGTLLVIAARLGPANPLGLVLALPPTQWLGRISYGWYLWHWPFIVVAELYFGALSGPARILAALASLAVADVTHRIIENPVRFHPKLMARHLPNYGLAAGLLAVSLTVTFASLASANDQLEQPRYQELLAAATDGFSTFDRGCQTNDADHITESCVWGDPAGSRSVLLLGDSHAEQWMPALDTIGTNNGLRILARVVAACPTIEVGVGFAPNPALCAETQSGTVDVVDRLQPDVVVVSQAAAAIDVLDNDRWAAEVGEFLAAMENQGVEVVWIHDTPTLDFDPIECLGSRDEPTCTPSRWESTNFAEEVRALDQPALDAVGAFSFNPLEQLCDDETCLLRFRNVLVFQDDNHITTAASLALVPELEPIILTALG